MSHFQVGQVTKLTAIVTGHLPGGNRVKVWIRGHQEPLAVEPGHKVGIGDTLLLEADVIDVADRAIAIKFHGHSLTIDLQFLEY